MEGISEVTQPVGQRKQRITKKQSKDFINWYWANPYVDDLSIAGVIKEYYQQTNVKVSRMFVSNVRRMFTKDDTQV